MANPIVKVILSAIDATGEGTKKAASGIEAWAGKVKGLVAGAGAAIAGSALLGFFKSATDEALAAQRASDLLQLAVERVGGSYQALEPDIERQVRALQRLGFADDDVVATLGDMITVSGNARGSLDSLGIVADLARAKNLDLGAAGEIVSKAMAGNTTALQKLYPELKGSTDVVADLGRTLAGTAEKHVETMGLLERAKLGYNEVKEAVGNVILSNGALGQGANWLADILGNLAIWIEKNETQLSTMATAVFDVVGALFDAARAVWDVVGPPLTWLAKVAFVGIVAGLNTVTLGVKRGGGVFQEFAGTAIAAIGALIEKGGKLFKLFGIDVVQSTGASLKQFGEDMVKNGTAAAERATREYGEAMGRLGDLINRSEATHTDIVTKGEGERRQVVRTSTAAQTTDHLAMEQARQKAAREANDLFQKTIDLLKKQNLTAHAAQWAEIDRNVRLVKGDLSDTLPGAEALKAEIDKNKAAMEANAAAAKDNKRTIKDSVDDAAQLGRAFLDVGQAVGVVSSEAAGVLNSVMNIGTSLAKIGIDPLGGMIGVIGGLANVITGIGNSEAHKAMREALGKNRDAVDRLSREVGNLALGATGRTFQGTQTALQATQAALAAGQFGSADGPGGAGRQGTRAMTFFRNQLLKQGVSREDAEKLIKELGFGDVFASGQTFTGSIGSLLTGLQDTEFGQFGQDFESQLQAIQDGFGILGIEDDATKFSQLSGLASRFSPALAAALGSGDPKAALQGLFKKLQTGELEAADFGQLNGSQFLDLIKLLLPLVSATSPVGSGETTAGLSVLGGLDFTKGDKIALPGDLGPPGDGFRIPLDTVVGGGLPAPAIGAQENQITFGDVIVHVPALTGDARVDGRAIGQAIRIALEEELPALTTAVLRRAGDEYARQRSAQGLS